MTRATAMLLGLIGVLVLAAGGLKLVRYTASGEPAGDASTVVERITALMEADGWRRIALQSGPRIPFTSLAFEKAGCARPLAIAILGRSRELIPLARLVQGDDIRLVDNDQLPLLAVAPASALASAGCVVPFGNKPQAAVNGGGRF